MQRGRQAGKEPAAGLSVAGAHGGLGWGGARGGRERRERGGQRNRGEKMTETFQGFKVWGKKGRGRHKGMNLDGG